MSNCTEQHRANKCRTTNKIYNLAVEYAPYCNTVRELAYMLSDEFGDVWPFYVLKRQAKAAMVCKAND